MAFDGCASLTDMTFNGAPPLFSASYPTPITFHVPVNKGWEEWEVPEGVTLVFEADDQVIELAPGWNWVSFSVLPESHNVNDVLGKTGFTKNDVIKTLDGSAKFNGSIWIASGGFTIESGKLYQVKTAKAVTLTLEGTASGETSVPLNAGWNWIANPTATAVPLSGVTFTGGFSKNDRITDGSVSRTYNGSIWLPAGEFPLEPGKGYKLKTRNAGTLVFLQ